MEKRHREVIQKNYVILVENCNLYSLLPVLVQKQVFSPKMVLDYTSTNPLKNKRQLFLNIQRRGPQAFVNLVSSLRETNQSELADILETAANKELNKREFLY